MAWRLLWCLLGLYVALDVRMVRVWRSDEALWTQAYRVSPTSPRAVVNYIKARQGVAFP